MTLKKVTPGGPGAASERRSWRNERDELRKAPLVWHLLTDYPEEKNAAARQLASDIKAGRLSAFYPRGSFDATSRRTGSGTIAVFARYLGEVVPTLEAPLRTDGTPILPNQSPYNELLANLASLNEIVAEVVQGLAAGDTPSPEFAELITTTLKEHNWRLGFRFRDEGPTAEFLEREEGS